MKYKYCKLGDVADVISGYAFKTKDFVKSGIGVIKIKNIKPPNISKDDMEYITEELAENLEKYKVKFNDILISMTGSNVNQFASAVGKIGKLRDKNNYYMLNQRVGKFILKNNSLYNYDFLYYFLTQPSIKWKLAISAGGSANQANISPKQIKEIKVPFPEIEIQKKISFILNSIDNKIDLNNKINENLQSISQLLFKHWFVDFEFPNEEGKPYKSSGGEMIDSELGKIPKGWKIEKLSKIVNMKNGVNYDRNQEGLKVKIINVRNFNGSLLVDNEKLDNIFLPRGQIENYLLKKFDTVIVRSTKPGETLLIFDDDIKVYSGFTIRIRSLNNLLKLYIFFFMRNSLKDIENFSNGTIFKNLNQKLLGDLNIAIPNMRIINIYNSILINILSEINMNLKENNNLSSLRDTLLPKLMNGEIDVSNIDLNE